MAYLLFRIADTFEDATRWSGAEQREALAAFKVLLSDPSSDQAAGLADVWTRHPPVESEAYEELLRETPGVVATLETLRPAARATICHHVTRTADGMADFVNPSGDVTPTEIVDLDGLRAYCYIVAGIVGEMLTDLFLLNGDQLAPAAQSLRDRAAAFGEGLQLTNILKDAGDDEQEGRRFLPRGLERSRIFDIARDDLNIAREYTGILQDAGAEPGLLAFNALPIAMAAATLDRVERAGPGAKITRLQVAAIIGKIDGSIRLGKRIFPHASVPEAVE